MEIEEILQKNSLTFVEKIKNNLIKCQDSAGSLFVVKKARGKECIMAELVNKLADRYNKKFNILKLPNYTNIDSINGYVIMPFYDGQDYCQLWSAEGNGGTTMKLELAKEMAIVIKDLKKINIKEVDEYLKQNNIERYKFNYNIWKKEFDNKIKDFIVRNYLSETEKEKANQILSQDFKKAKILFNNGDYYPRNLNFLKKENKLVLLDWQTWDESYRANIVDYIENIIAFAYIHMWNNPEWQVEFIKRFREIHRINFRNLQKAILIKSFEQAHFWINSGNLCNDQLDIFENALEDSYFESLEKNTRPNIFILLKTYLTSI